MEMPDYLPLAEAVALGDSYRASLAGATPIRNIEAHEWDVAMYFGERLPKLRLLAGVVSRQACISTSTEKTNVLGSTDGVQQWYPAMLLEYTEAKINHTAEHENNHGTAGCTDCALFEGMTTAHMHAVEEWMGPIAAFDAVQMDEGFNELHTRKDHGKNLDAYNKEVETAEKLEKALQEAFGISLVQLHAAGDKQAMARWVRMFADRALLRQTMETAGCEDAAIDFAMKQMDVYPGMRITSASDAELVMKHMLEMYRDEQEARGALEDTSELR